jgi:hypothetical protein
MPTSTPTPITADYTLVAVLSEDLQYSLFAVRTDGTGKQLLDQGAHGNYYGKIVNGRAYFERHNLVASPTPGSDRDIYSVNIDGSDRRQLTSGADDDHIAAIVGDRIVIERILPPTASQSTDLVSIRLDGSDLRLLANDPQRRERVAVEAADGQHVLINSANTTDNDLYSLRVDGSSAPIAIAVSPGRELVRGLIGNTVIFEDDRTTSATFGDQLIQVNARNVDGNGLIVLSEGANDQHYYLGNIDERVVIWNRNARTVETVKLDGTARQQFVKDVLNKPFLRDALLFFEGPDSLGVQQVFGFDLLAALKGSKKPPVQLTHASSKSRILNFAPAELKTVIVYRQNDLLNPSTASIYAVQFGSNGVKETLLADNASTVYSNFVHQGRLIFQRLFETYYSVKLDGTGMVQLLNAETSVIENVNVLANGRLVVTRYISAPAGSPFPELGQVFAVNADASNPTPLTALSPEAAWVGY